MGASRLLSAISLWGLLTAAQAGALAGGPAGEEGEAISEREEFVRRLRTEVTKFGFEEKIAQDPGHKPMPRQWERHLEYLRSPAPPPTEGGASREVLTSRPLEEEGPLYYGRFPDYLKVEVMDLDRGGTPAKAAHGGRRAIRMELAGTRDMEMVGVRRRVPLDVDPGFAYELTGWVRLEGVKKPGTYAQLWIEWLDENGKQVGRSRSDRVDQSYLAAYAGKRKLKAAPAWVPTPEFRVNEIDSRARSARVWCVASGREIGSYAYFDDLEILRRPKVSAEPDQPDGYGIFTHREVPALSLSFQGLEAGPGRGKVTGYRRVIRTVDLLGRAQPELVRDFDPRDVRGGGLGEHVQLEGLASPGAYAVQIVLEATGAGGSRSEVAKRTVRLVKLPPARERTSRAERERFGVDLDLYRPEAAHLSEAAVRGGFLVLAPRLWRPATNPAGFRSAGEEARPEEDMEKRLRDLTASRLIVEGVLSPVPASLQAQFRDFRGARTLYSAGPDRWQPLMKATVSHFQSYLSAWRISGARDPSFGGPNVPRGKLAEGVGELLKRAPSRVVIVPRAFGDLTAPAPAMGSPNYRELVYIPAGVSAKQLAARLDELFPQAQSGPSPMAGRQWFIELSEAGENLSLRVTSERRQAADLARKVTLLATRGAERFFTELADPRRGLLGPSLAPRPAYAAYGTLAAELSGAEYLGEFDLASGVEAYAFQRGGAGLVVFWADRPEDEAGPREVPCQLGAPEEVRLVELTGAERRLRPPGSRAEGRGLPGAQMVPLSTVPALLTGLEPAFIRTRLGFRLAGDARLESRYQPQEVAFEIRNYFQDSMNATVFPLFPRGCYVKPRFRRANIEAGKKATVAFSVRPSFAETVGPKEMTVDLRLSSGSRRRVAFTITRKLLVESAVRLEPTVTALPDGRTAEVQVQVRLSPEARFSFDAQERPHGLSPQGKYDLELSLAVPGGVRQRARLRDVRVGVTERPDAPFVVSLGARPRTAYAGARLRGSPWFTNVEVKLPAAGQP